MAVSHRRIRSTRLLVVALLLTSLVTITMDVRGGREGPLALIGRGAGAVMGPLQEGVAAVFRPVGSFFGNVFRAGSLAQRNAALEEEIALLRRQQQEVLQLQRVNEELTRLLGLRERLGFQTTGATVIGESPSNFEWSVIIDRGSSDGVAIDMPVMASEGLVGRVVEVLPNQAKVMLIIDPDSAVSARLTASGERGALLGQRDEPLLLDLVEVETEVQPGEPVVTSGYTVEEGLEGLFPPDIPIGVVERVEPDEANLTLDVYVRPNVDFSALDFVLVVTGSDIPEPVTESPSPSPSPTSAS